MSRKGNRLDNAAIFFWRKLNRNCFVLKKIAFSNSVENSN